MNEKSKLLFKIYYIEALERFAFLGFLGIFVFYLHDNFSYTKGEASAISASLGASIYSFGIIGAYLADRVFGSLRCVKYGLLFLTLSYLFFTFDYLKTGMFFIVLGSMLIKSNISNLISLNYKDNLSSAFSGFYIFVNLGCLFGQLFIGYIALQSYKIAFLFSFFSMLISMIIFSTIKISNDNIKYDFFTQYKKEIIIFLIILATVFFQNYIELSKVVGFVATVLPFCIILFLRYKNDIDLKDIIIYFFAAILFYMLIFQCFNTLNFLVKSKASGLNIPSSWYLAFMYFIALIASFILNAYSKNKTLDERNYIIFSLFAVALAFLLLAYLSSLNSIYFIYLLVVYFILGFAQTIVGALGLSKISKLSPKGFEASMLGLWFLCSASAQGLESLVVKLIDKIDLFYYFGVQGFVVLVFSFLMLKAK